MMTRTRQRRLWGQSFLLCLALLSCAVGCVIDFQQLFPPTESISSPDAQGAGDKSAVADTGNPGTTQCKEHVGADGQLCKVCWDEQGNTKDSCASSNPTDPVADCYNACIKKSSDVECKTLCSTTKDPYTACYDACIAKGSTPDVCKPNCLKETDPINVCYNNCIKQGGSDAACKVQCDPVSCYNGCIKSGGQSGVCWKKCSP